MTAPALSPEPDPEPARRPTQEEALQGAARAWARVIVRYGLTKENPYPQQDTTTTST